MEKIKKKDEKQSGVFNGFNRSGGGIRKYLKLERKGARKAYLDKDKIKEEALWDGFSGVITNHHTNCSGQRNL